MKKYLSTILLLLVFLSSNIGTVSAFEQAVSSLEREKDCTEAILENLEKSTDTYLDLVNLRTPDQEQSEHIEQKQKEIAEVLVAAEQSLENADNKKEIQAVVQETKTLITLKTESAVTPVTDVVETLEKNPELRGKDIAQATDTLIDSLEVHGKVRIMIQSSLSGDEIRNILTKYDPTFGLVMLSETDGIRIYELTLTSGGLLEQELFPNTETGELPKTLFGMEIIRPEIYTLSEDLSSSMLGESWDNLWGIQKYGGMASLNTIAPRAKTQASSVRVAIIDTGIEASHKDLSSVVDMASGYDFVNDDSDPTDDQGHGTHVAGTIAGAINGAGVVGVNPFVHLTALKICDNKGFCPSYAVIKALAFAKEKKFDVLNMSLGARGNPETSPICKGIDEVTEVGSIVIAAAGNSNVDTSTFVPGGCKSTITVAAVDRDLKRASFSNYGTKVDIAAPGVGVYSSYLGGGYKSLNGTSMATPHIVGLASIIRMYQPHARTGDVRTILQNSTLPVSTDTNKPISAFADGAKIISYLQSASAPDAAPPKQEPTTKEIPKEIPKEEKVALPTINKDDQNLNPIIDESIGLTIQNNEKIEINSLPESTKNDAVEVNSSDDAGSNNEGTLEDVEPQNFQSESVEVNNTADSIDFSQLDTTSAIVSNGDPKKLYEQEKISIDLDDRDIPEGYTAINSDTEEEYPVNIGEQDEPLAEASEDTAIQNTYTCTTYVGYTCSYSLAAAGIRQYNMSNTSVATVSASNSAFTITGRSPGQSTLYVNYAGRTIATVYVTIQRMLVPLSASYGTDTLTSGQNTYLMIRSGNGGYNVTSSNPTVIGVTGSNTNWTLTAMSPGTATITYRDSAGYYGTVIMTVPAPPRELRASIGQTTLEKGKTTALSITDGNGGYTVTSSNPSVVSVMGYNTNWTLTGISPGTAMITIRDTRGRVLTLSLTVTTPVPIRTLYCRYYATTLQIGGTSPIAITDGNGGYSVTSSNPAVLTVGGSNTNWTLTAKSPGTVTVTIQDQRGMTARLNYTVLRPISGTLSNISPRIGESPVFTVTDGNGGYTVTSSNTAVATVRQTTTGIDTSYTITPLAVGETILTLRDKYGLSGWIKMTVQPSSKPLTLDKTTLTVEVGSDAYFQITSGNGGYGYSMNNSNVGWYFDNTNIPSYRIRGLTPGTTLLQIRDSAGKVVQVRVEVKQKAIEPQFQNVSYTQVSEGLWDIRFDVSNSDYSEIGIEQNGSTHLLSTESDNNYYVQVYNTNCTSGTSACDFTGKVYLVSRSGKKIYTFPKTLAYFSPETAMSYIANADEETSSGVEVNGIKEDIQSGLTWGVSQVTGTVKKIDVTKHFVNWNNLSTLQREEFYEGVRDTLSLNNFYDLATNIGAGVAIEKIATIVGKALIAKYGKKVAFKLGVKMVPYLGWALLGYSIGTAGAENIEYMTLCANENLSVTKDGKGPLYYCGKLAVNGMFIGAGLGVSRLHSVGVFKKLEKVVWSKVPKPDMNKVKNQTLRNIIEQNLYKDGSSYGNGSLADAIRFEKATGLQVEGKWHTKSGEDNRNALIKVYDFLNQDEKLIAETLYADISNALNGN